MSADNKAGLSSAAVSLRSLGPGRPKYPLAPPLLRGCPKTSDDTMQFPLEVVFDYDRIDRRLFEQAPLPGIGRWSPLLPPLAHHLSLGEGGTPLTRLPLPDLFDGELWLKDETQNPTWSHKDRLNLCNVSAAVHAGAPGIVVSSSGNHGVSAAAYAARAGLRCIVLTMPEVSPVFLAMLQSYGASVVAVPADARWPLMSELVDRTGFHAVSNVTPFHTGHPYGPEGYKTIAYELFLQLERSLPDTVVVPTGYGEQLFGLFKGFSELVTLGLARDIPHLYSVEPSARGPVKAAVDQGLPATSVQANPTEQLSIACTVSGYRAIHALEESDGIPLVVRDSDAIAARRRLGLVGHHLELSAASAVAAIPQIREMRSSVRSVVVIGTSGGFKDPSSSATVPTIEPTMAELAKFVQASSGWSLS